MLFVASRITLHCLIWLSRWREFRHWAICNESGCGIKSFITNLLSKIQTKGMIKRYLLAIISFIVFPLCAIGQEVMVDSDITLAEALEGTIAPKEVTDELVIVDVEYYSIDGKLHRGQIVVHESLEDDVVEIFEVIKEEKIIVEMVIPIRFDRPGGNTYMEGLNNSYGFHYRYAVGGRFLSNHSYGRAIDINPFDNPYISSKGDTLPKGCRYEPLVNSRALTSNSILVKKFLELGWTWGGDWKNPKDYMHFEKKN